ncbi:hypothetical protein [Streptomyces mirabilis]|uniref:Tn3 transposase DDE domain-containing protein n=1 Tax=Streptomyces mirabilis TaxID=68239 RepID=A0A1I2WXQ2_9ACTN|nr:hypothetical protein [Streptomyces mirabilis]SFH06070.1 hypothetical protein SAMN02787118_1414 [Streptomyces mirabilis]
MTSFKAVSDQVAGLGAVRVPGTVRDLLHLLDCLLNLDGGARPEVVNAVVLWNTRYLDAEVHEPFTTSGLLAGGRRPCVAAEQRSTSW